MKSTNSINKTIIKNNIMNKNSILLIALTVILVACGGGGSDKKAELEKLKKQKSELETKIAALEEEVAKSDTTANKEKGTEVVAMPLSPTIFKAYIEVQGRVDADENVSLSIELPAPGTISKILVKVGDHVSKGQVLAETDQRPLQQQLITMQANLALANQVYEKQKNLWDQKIGTEIQFLQAKTTKETTEATIAGINEQLRMSKIISPIDGTVDFVDIKIGQAVQPGKGVINVVNFNSLKVKAAVAEGYASRIHNGDEVIVVFPDMNDTIQSKIHYASRAIDALTRTFAVEALLDSKKEYHPNTVAKLKINDYKSAKPVIVVPVKFIQKAEEGSYVMVDEKGKAAKKAVVLGREYNGNAEVVSGLNEGDLIITEGYDLVNEGSSIVSVKK